MIHPGTSNPPSDNPLLDANFRIKNGPVLFRYKSPFPQTRFMPPYPRLSLPRSGHAIGRSSM